MADHCEVLWKGRLVIQSSLNQSFSMCSPDHWHQHHLGTLKCKFSHPTGDFLGKNSRGGPSNLYFINKPCWWIWCSVTFGNHGLRLTFWQLGWRCFGRVSLSAGRSVRRLLQRSSGEVTCPELEQWNWNWSKMSLCRKSTQFKNFWLKTESWDTQILKRQAEEEREKIEAGRWVCGRQRSREL